MYNQYSALINIQFEATDDTEAKLVAQQYSSMATSYKSIGADKAEVVECIRVLPPPNKKLLVVDLFNTINTKYINPDIIGSWLHNKVLSNYRFIVITNSVMEIITIDTNDCAKVQELITSKFK